jgi:hypothetical protein
MLLRSFNGIRELEIMVMVGVAVMVAVLSVAHPAVVAVRAVGAQQALVVFLEAKVVIVGAWSDRLRIPAQSLKLSLKI